MTKTEFVEGFAISLGVEYDEAKTILGHYRVSNGLDEEYGY